VRRSSPQVIALASNCKWRVEIKTPRDQAYFGVELLLVDELSCIHRVGGNFTLHEELLISKESSLLLSKRFFEP
jgi:hypothetical protein